MSTHLNQTLEHSWPRRAQQLYSLSTYQIIKDAKKGNKKSNSKPKSRAATNSAKRIGSSSSSSNKPRGGGAVKSMKVARTAPKQPAKKDTLISPDKIKIQISNTTRTASAPSFRSAPKRTLSNTASPKSAVTKKASRVVEVVKSQKTTSFTSRATGGGRRNNTTTRTLTLNDRFSRKVAISCGLSIVHHE
ncbi:hypothetical protein PPL_05011 [Heterostelium album PN500]|uniref:Uncharacterized protein n=1 Tax=Heterostelium pallidum (strain ATCC 26659 / Pp 5 / PN500) TaxID=670386 RepID=D3B967_HETP5|nr:hypothetical protein PPL_05011 [Heterostelium album PN500]EFA82106.1 hypothetical protein PPL_05011 [Heterostelium album PN500]|eukprot:XP_020434223.1 hypothetical protein PPL_05011 [Heterostelium album PN500]